MESNINKYTYCIQWSEEDQAHVAGCLEFPSLSAHGDSTENALKEIKFAVSETVRWLEEENEPVPEPLGVKRFKEYLSISSETDQSALSVYT